MSSLPPAEVLAARLEHELKTIGFYARDEDVQMLQSIARAQEILAQLQEAMR